MDEKVHINDGQQITVPIFILNRASPAWEPYVYNITRLSYRNLRTVSSIGVS